MYGRSASTRAATIRTPAARSQASTSAVGAVAERHAEDGPGARPDRVRVEQVGPRRGGDDGIRPGPVGAAQHRAEVARLLDALDDHDAADRRAGRAPRERSTGCGRPRPAPRRARRTRAWRRPVRSSAWIGVPSPRAAGRARPARPVPPGVVRRRRPRRPRPRVERAAELARAVDERQPGPLAIASVAQGDRGRDPRVRRARQQRRGRGRHADIMTGRRTARRRRASSPPVRRRPGSRSPASIDAARPPSRGRAGRAASRSRPKPWRVGGQQHETVGLEQLAARGRAGPAGRPRSASRRRSRTVPVGRRVEDDPGVAAAAPDLAPGERRRVVDDPADRPVGEPGQVRVVARPGDRRARRVHVRDAGPGGGHRERGEPRVGEEVEHGRRRHRGRSAAAAPAPARAARPRRAATGSIAACSGNSPTWPASVGRSSSVTPSIVDRPRRARRRPRRSSRGRGRSAGRRRASAAGSAAGPERGRLTAGRSPGRRSVRAVPPPPTSSSA